jgi:hypothetical protein
LFNRGYALHFGLLSIDCQFHISPSLGSTKRIP